MNRVPPPRWMQQEARRRQRNEGLPYSMALRQVRSEHAAKRRVTVTIERYCDICETTFTATVEVLPEPGARTALMLTCPVCKASHLFPHVTGENEVTS